MSKFQITTPREVRDQRRQICEGCKHYKKIFRSCGNLIVGRKLTPEEIEEAKAANLITRNKQTFELCGCFMPLKWRIPWVTCPLQKWGLHGLTEAEIEELKNFLDSLPKNVLASKEVTALFTWAGRIRGTRVTTCGECVQGIIDEMRKNLNEYYGKN
jgi:hypothetical protein